MQFNGHTHERSIMYAMNERLRAMYTFTWRLGELNIAVQVLLMIVLKYFTIATAIKYYVAGQLTLGDFALIQSALASIFGVLWGFGRTMRHLGFG
jgi:ABC-type multidrug transport system fused ATPase/permease subunit